MFPKSLDHVIPYAHKDSQIPARPSWICVEGSYQLHPGDILSMNSLADIISLTLVPFAVCAALVAFELE